MSEPATILIVDDEPANRRLLESMLKREGFSTCCAENGRECLTRVQQGGIDLVLLDVMMPVLDGVAACRAIREELRLPQLPVVLVTALNDRGARVRGKEAGADDYISKPVYAEELFARVRVLLRTQQCRRVADEQRVALELARHRLTSLLVHDLKGPLSVIRVNLEHIRSFTHDIDDRELHAAAHDALTGCEQIQHMLLDMLDIGLAEDGQLPFAPVPGDVGVLLAQAGARFRPVIEERGATLRVDIANEQPVVSFDASLILRVVQNLLGNAARFVPVGGVAELQVRTGVGRVVITVGNDGPDIPPEVQARLFDKFGQLTDSQRKENRGLGLYLCRLVAERHGGSIAVRDRQGGGACFDLELPAILT